MTDSDITELKTAIESNTKAIASLAKEMRLGLVEIKKDIKTKKAPDISSTELEQMLRAIELMSRGDLIKLLLAATQRLAMLYERDGY